jgi:hypothetical protein
LFQLTGAVAIFIGERLSAGTCVVIDHVIEICAINNLNSNAVDQARRQQGWPGPAHSDPMRSNRLYETDSFFLPIPGSKLPGYDRYSLRDDANKPNTRVETFPGAAWLRRFPVMHASRQISRGLLLRAKAALFQAWRHQLRAGTPRENGIHQPSLLKSLKLFTGLAAMLSSRSRSSLKLSTTRLAPTLSN